MKEFNFKLKIFGLTIFAIEYSIENKEVAEPERDHCLEALKEAANKIEPVSSIGAGTIRPDLKELEKKLNNEQDVPKPIKVKCKTCEGITYDDDINFCDGCGKEICSNCGSIDVDGKKYCQECWINV